MYPLPLPYFLHSLCSFAAIPLLLAALTVLVYEDRDLRWHF
jgi:hypothetical protein